jgi:hypothetical protein
LPKELTKLKGIVDKGLEQTAALWPDVRVGFDLIHRAAHELGNERALSGRGVRRRYKAALDGVRAAAARAAPRGDLRKGLGHFVKVTASYEPGLFHCYDVPGLPRTNNDLEQLFGSTRHHERRCTGRKAASPGLVLRGSVRVLAGLGTRDRRFSGGELAPADPQAWRTVRTALEQRREARVLRCRFRRNPAKYLQQLEAKLLKPALPS